ncbi:MAG: hypothetical protein LBD56_01150 [Endomicrobium sp.]|nr:hypothetical protein [Endomicrobium sp.]
MSGSNPKILRNYLSPIGLSSVLIFRDPKLKDTNIDRVLYLITTLPLQENFKYVLS